MEARGLSFRYAGSRRPEPALDGVSLTLRAGEFVGVTGPTGAGKSTLCAFLNGLIPHTLPGEAYGQVRIDGLSTAEVRPNRLARLVGSVFQNPEDQIVSFHVDEEVAFGPENLAVPADEIGRRVREALEATGLWALRGKPTAALSGGQKQRLAIAAVLACRPSLLVLDEPTAELDPAGTRDVFEALARLNAEHGVTVLVVEHKTEWLARHASRLLVLDRGRLVADGRPAEVLGDLPVMEALGIPVPARIRWARRRVDGVPAGNGEVRPASKGGGEDPGAAIGIGATPRATTGNGVIVGADVGGPLLEVAGLVSGYGPEPVLHGVDLTVRRGEMLALVGENGAGKTTLVKHWVGLLRPHAGSVRLGGQDAARRPVHELARSVGYVWQNPDHALFLGSVREELAFGPRNLGLGAAEVGRRVAAVSASLGLDELLDEDPGELSRGQRQRVAVGAVLAMEPDLLVLDEPTTGQDARESREIMDLLARVNAQGTAICFITHDMELVARYARRVVVVAHGRVLVDGSPRQVFASPRLLQEAGLDLPPATRLARELLGEGAPVCLTLEELEETLRGAAGVAGGKGGEARAGVAPVPPGSFARP
ncbi:ABC transporter [Limnochorda pilosa]|uniref:ABC transporter n=1 Tax=Limnochorda pilosa TaxID=1555112 RepID=A0A0K2SJN3_LIMPI|nr:ABC transporter [Limnochorda pilosa]